MKTRNKAIVLTLCALVLVAASVMGTVAYLTAKDNVKNTFTVGNIALTLDEAKVGADGQAIKGDGASRVKANAYQLLPGKKYDKDPIVHVTANTPAYVFIKVENGLKNIISGTAIEAQITTSGWTALEDVTGVYYKKVDAKNSVQDLGTFKDFTISADATNETLAAYGEAKINVTAYAIQQQGFGVSEAWAEVSK